MKIPLSILAFVAVALVGIYLFAPRPDPMLLNERTDLPWQIEVDEDGSSHVFGLHLGHASLADAIAKFGGLEGLAVFQSERGELALEAYFGKVRFGPLSAQIVTRLAADEHELMALRDSAAQRKGSRSGDWKFPLSTGYETHLARRLRVLTYIPGSRDLDQAFILDRFGQPAATLRESERAVSWFYPAYGLSILIDDKAREVFEYQAPRAFRMPAGAQPYTAVTGN